LPLYEAYNMKLNLGLSHREKYEALLQWHDHFAWSPVRVGNREHRWLETVERRGKGTGISGRMVYEYRAKGE